MEFQVELMPRAIADLDEITWYIGRENLQSARRFYEDLVGATMALGKFPEMGRKVPEIKNLVIREVVFGSYRIIYRVEKRLEKISVLRFWHAARGTPKI